LVLNAKTEAANPFVSPTATPKKEEALSQKTEDSTFYSDQMSEENMIHLH